MDISFKKFKKIIVVNINDFNENKETDSLLPQNGYVVNGFYSFNLLGNYVVLGFE